MNLKWQKSTPPLFFLEQYSRHRCAVAAASDYFFNLFGHHSGLVAWPRQVTNQPLQPRLGGGGGGQPSETTFMSTFYQSWEPIDGHCALCECADHSPLKAGYRPRIRPHEQKHFLVQSVELLNILWGLGTE